jgi:hypothetical protein
MAFVLNDRVLETSTTNGTGAFTLAGAASGFQSFSAGVGASNTTYYCIVNTAASEWEVGFGTLDATGLILARTTVYRSSNSNNLVTFTAGTKNVFVTYPATRSVNLDTTGVLALTSAVNSPLTINNGGTGTAFTNSVASFFGDVNSYSQVNHENLNAGNSASTDYIATADNGTDTTNFVDFGINSSTYNVGTFTITGANEGYIYSQSTNFAVGTGTAGAFLKFFQGGTLAANEVARFAPTTNNFLVGTTSDGAGTSKMRVNGVIEAITGVKVGTSTATQTFPFAPTNIMVSLGASVPVVSGTYVFTDANATTTSRIAINPNPAVAAATLLAVGAITAGSGYANNTYFNVPLTGGTGTGATATQITVSVGAVTSVSMPTSASAVVNGSITAGSGYSNGTYLNVPLTGGAGVGAVATSITVAGGIVTAVVLPTTGVGSNYVVGNSLTASNAFLGGAGAGFAYSVTAVSTMGTGYAYGDTLSASNANLGGSGSGFSVPVALLSAGGDELEMDGLKVSAYCATNGLISVFVDASPGYIAGGRNFTYTLG